MGSTCLLVKVDGEPEAGLYNKQRDWVLNLATERGLFKRIVLDIEMPDGSKVVLFRRARLDPVVKSGVS